MSALKISIPKQIPGHILSIGTQYEEIKSWVDKLPLFDADTTIQKVLPVLIELNRTKVDNKLYFSTMQLFSNALKHPIETSKKKYSAIPLPLTAKHKASSHRIKRLLNEMAHGYKIIISKHILKSNQRLPIDEITKATYFAIHYIGRLILERYLCYEKQPPNTWMEITELYRFAITLCIESAPINIEDKKQSTINLAYLQVLLLAAINPYRLTRSEASTVYSLMGDWCRHCNISIPPQSWKPTNELIVQPTHYGVIYHARPGEKVHDFKNIRIININKLKAFMHTRCKNKKRTLSTLSERLMQNMFLRLLDGWRFNNSVRKTPRADCTKKTTLVLGLNACYSVFGGKHPKTDHPAHTKMSLLPIKDETGNPWAATISSTKIKPGDTSQFAVDDPSKDIWRKQTLCTPLSDLPKNPSFKLHLVIQTDYSDTGLSVRFDFSNGLTPNVGDLVSLKPEKAGENKWELGAIRWMEFSQKYGSLGIKLFPFTPTPVATKALTGVGKGSDIMQSILLSPAGLKHPEAIIIVPASVYDIGSQLYVELQTQSAQITLTSLHDFSKSFACYSFKYLTL